MNRGLAFLLAIGAVVLGVAYALRETGPPKEDAPAAEDVSPQVETIEPSPPGEEPPTPSALEVRGLILGPSLGAVAGVSMALGEERATSGVDGAFSFPASLRPRTVDLKLVAGGHAVEWPAMLAGPVGMEPGGDVASIDDRESYLLPPSPAKLRWTFNLPAGSSPAPGASWITIDDACAEDWGVSVRVRIRGRSRLPEGASISTSLYFDGQRFIADAEPAVVKGGGFVGSLYSASGTPFFSGSYQAEASYSVVLQDPGVFETWSRERPEEDWQSVSFPEVRRDVFVGDPAEARAEDLKAQAYYLRALTDSHRLWRELKVRMDLVRKLRRGTAPGPRRSPVDGSDLLEEDGKLGVARWRKFLDEDWRPRLQVLTERHAERGVEKYPEAGRIFDLLLSSLLQASYAQSRFVVYPFLNLPPDEKDFFPDEEAAGDLIRLERIILGSFDALEKYKDLVAG